MELSARHAPRGNYLRYQFDTAAQVLRHCRMVDGRVLLFFPDPYPRLAVRSRVLIEISLAEGQQISLPAQVTARDENAGGGTWLAMRALAIVTGLQVAASSPRRRERRLAFDQLAWVEHGGGPVLACPVLDLSRGGARLWGVPGGIPAPEQNLRVRMNGAPTLRARIAWAHGREVGVQFAEDCSPSAERLYQRVEQLWSSARLVSHDPRCRCAVGGIANDPPVPSRAEQQS